VDVYRTGTARIDMYDNWQSVVGTCMHPTWSRLALHDGRAVEYCGRNTDEHLHGLTSQVVRTSIGGKS
jgi:hypothetical protein